jgi:hypothetical protein
MKHTVTVRNHLYFRDQLNLGMLDRVSSRPSIEHTGFRGHQDHPKYEVRPLDHLACKIENLGHAHEIADGVQQDGVQLTKKKSVHCVGYSLDYVGQNRITDLCA